jgi:Glycosyltransferase
VQEGIIRCFKKNNYVIQNGVDSHIFFPKENSIKKKYGLEEKDLLLFSPRAIDPLYNIDIIIDSLYLLQKKNINIKCMFSYAFGNEYLVSLQTKVSDYGITNNIIWLGYLSYAEMAEKYNAADIIISIPKSDSSPRSVYEGMFCQKPVIISDLEWSHEFLTKNCVYRLKNTNSTCLSNAIEKIYRDENLKKMISEESLIVAKKYFDYQTNMESMEKIMRDYIRNKFT